VSHYPWWAVWQAAAVATALKQRRNLDDAGWAVWVLGFPVTPFARQLLLRELRRQGRLYRQLLKPGMAERAAVALGRDRRGGGATFRKAAGPHLPRTLRFLADLHLGTLPTRLPEEDELEDVQLDLARWLELTTGVAPGTLTSSTDLPDKPTIRRAVVDFSRARTIPVLRRAVKELPEWKLRLARDEAQTLTSHVAQAVGWEDAPFITRPAFIDYLWRRFLDPAAAKDTVATLRALGWTRPPLSPFAALVAEHQANSPIGASS
jgi:hypothetical protein